MKPCGTSLWTSPAGALAKAFASFSDDRSLASELGAVEMVISAMKGHEDAPGVQGQR